MTSIISLSRFKADLLWRPRVKISRITCLWVMVVLLLFTCWMGASGLRKNALWYDEIFSEMYAGGQQYGPISGPEVVNRVVSELQIEKNPPGYYVLLHYWGSVTGWSDLADRYLSLLVGLLAVALTFRIGFAFSASLPRASRYRIALASAFAVGVSGYFAFYLYEMRTYALVTAFAAAVIWLYWQLIHAKRLPRPLFQMAFVLCAVGMLYAHYQGILLLLFIGIYHLLFVPKNKRWLRVTLLALAAVLLYTPWIFIAVYSLLHGQLTAPQRSLLNPLEGLALTFSNNAPALLLLLLGIAAYFCWWKERVRDIWIFAVGGLLVALAFDHFYPYIMNIRYIFFLWPLLAVLFGLALEYLTRLKFPILILAAIWIGAAVGTQTDATFKEYVHGTVLPWRYFHSVLEERVTSNDFVAFESGNYDWIHGLEFDHYMYGLPVKGKMMESLPGRSENDDFYNQTTAYISQFNRVWVGVSNLDPPNFRLNDFDRALNTDGFTECDTAFNLPSMSLSLYAHLPQTLNDTTFRFGDGIGLKLLEPVRTLPNGRISILAGWFKSDTVPDETYSVAFHVDDAAGNVVSQTDYGLSDSRNSCKISDVNLHPGHYTVLAVVYAWKTNMRLIGENMVTGQQADRIPVGTVDVK